MTDELPLLSSSSPIAVWPALLLASLAIALAGARLAGVADRLADRSGLGEAFVGGLFVGGTTSLSGIVVSVTAGADGLPSMAFGNALGGIAAQTAFLAIADLCYARANLEHAAASLPNLVQGTLLITLLALPIAASSGPPVTLWSVHPASLLLIGAYLAGMLLVREAHGRPMWQPRVTAATTLDEPDADEGSASLSGLAARFAILAAVVGAAGFVVARCGESIVGGGALSGTATGALVTAVSTSLPELVTTVAAVRRGALTLAVAAIIGGNCFDVLLIAFSDIAYRGGSLYHALHAGDFLVVGIAIAMTGVVLLGMLRRERHGIANIGLESVLLLLIYTSSVALLAHSG